MTSSWYVSSQCWKLRQFTMLNTCEICLGHVNSCIYYSEADQRKHQSSASLAVVRGLHRGPVNSPHKWPVTQKKFPFDDVIMTGKSRGNISWWSVENCTLFFYWQRQLDVITLPWSSTDVRAWMSNHTLFKAQQCREICQCSCTRHLRGI